MIRALILPFVLVLGIFASGPCARSGESPAQAFFGHYDGKAILVDDGETTMRDLAVTIEPSSEGFSVGWTTVSKTKDGKEKRKTYVIAFEPSVRPGIFRSAMRTDLFGNRVPHDPMKGEPYVWCRINGRTLSLYALVIDDDGGYDLQVYDRTLTDDGLDLHFTRLHEGEPPKVLKATLQKTAR
ncbi:MAG: hypothetical protein IPK66_11160 [Rhodospirillales bacterium]|nr:hypothetical protein [Rhodospirillales bacterium]